MINTNEHTVLVVEDNDFVRMQMAKFLKDAGFNVLEAASADQGLEQVSPAVSAIIADLRMEPADGFEFIASVRAQRYDTPVLLVTGDQNPDILEKSSRFNLTAIMMKPVQKERLISMVSRAIVQRSRNA